MAYVWYFLRVAWYPLAAIVICGLVVYLCERLILRLMGGTGNIAVKITSFVGTPVHELGHAAMCLLFGHTITEVKLWQPSARDGTLGYVTHKYNPKNPYHVFGNLFIGVGPVFSGVGVLTLVMYLCFPDTLCTYTSTAWNMVQTGAGEWSIFLEGLQMIPRMIGELTIASPRIWGQILGVVILLSVSLHISLSPADIKGALRALPMYLVLVLLVTVITALIGPAAMTAVLGGLQLFHAYLMAMFVIVLVFSCLYLLPALIVWVGRCLFSRR